MLMMGLSVQSPSMIGDGSIEDLHKCRQVSQSWNVMITHMTKYKKDKIRREAKYQAFMIRKRWNGDQYMPPFPPFLPEIVTAASLAHHGLMDSLEEITLWDVDLASVPAEHLASLASCVTDFVGINNISNIDLMPVLDNMKCEVLSINSQSLRSEETQSLVRALESNVTGLVLGHYGEVSLDITTLTQYSGQGKCRRVVCWRANADMYREELVTWAQRVNWAVKQAAFPLYMLYQQKL